LEREADGAGKHGMNSILLDTNAYTRCAAGDSTILQAIREGDIVSMSVFVLSELLDGFKQGSRER
jgi:predicted nucleic acid-binding protein